MIDVVSFYSAETTLDAGGDCSITDNTRCNPDASPALTCDGGKCKIQAGANCAAATTQCTANAKCDTVCKCNAPDYAAATGGVCVGTKELDEACSNDNCIPTAVCDGGTCKKKESTVNGSCTVASKAACDPTTLACQSDKCKSKIGVDCLRTGDCVAGATCSESKCNCPTGVVPSSDKTQCGGAMGIAASMLLVVATFVTSRFL
ncbi:prion-like-(Q/N-rich) domain-bearing protein 25 [Littorina saxatilis]|uniref:prion-like-(Q/N-rich) domain-bearing protein 25 n=1 Tax=Littorina saxatilis TaxID=31220 RepID=UPI0038B4C557